METVKETGVGGYEKARLEVMDDHYAVIIGGIRFRTEGKTEQDLQAAERLIAVTPAAAQAETLQGIIDQLRNNAREIHDEIKDLTGLVKSYASRSDAANPTPTGKALAIDLLREVMQSHRDKESPEYNECDKAPCKWCDDAGKAIQKLTVTGEEL